MENLEKKPTNWCPKCEEIIEVKEGLSAQQEMFFHTADCDPTAKKRKAEKMRPVEIEVLNPLASDEDFIREVNVVCGRDVTLKCWQLHAVKHIINKFTEEGLQSFVLADEMGLGKTLSAICIALLFHRSAAVRHRLRHNKFDTAALPSNANSSGLFLIICPKATVYDAWMRGLEKFTAMGDRVFHYEGHRREERLIHMLETVNRYNLRNLTGRTFRQKNKRLLFIITTPQTACRECMPNRKMNNIKRARERMSGRRMCGENAAGSSNATKKKFRKDPETDSLLFKLPYTLVIFDEVHKAKTGPSTDPAPPDDANSTVAVLTRPAYDKTCRVGTQLPSQVYTMLHHLTHVKEQRVLGLTGTPIANRMSDIANLSNALNLPVRFHHTETFFSVIQKDLFKNSYFLRRTKAEVDIQLPPMVVVDKRVPFNSPETTTMSDYCSGVETLQKLATTLSYWMTRAHARVPGAFAQLQAVQAQYQGCIMQLRVIAAAPISWPYSKVTMSLKNIMNMFAHYLKTHFNVYIQTMKTVQSIESTGDGGEKDSDAQAANVDGIEPMEFFEHFDSDDDEVDLYDKCQASSLELKKRQELAQLQLDEAFIDVGEADEHGYGRELRKAKRKLQGGHGERYRGGESGVASHPMGGLRRMETAGEAGAIRTESRGEDKKEDSEEGIKALLGKKKERGKHQVCPTLDDMIMEIARVRVAIDALKEILEDRGVAILEQLLPTPSQWSGIQGRLALLSTSFTSSPDHLCAESMQRLAFISEMNSLWKELGWRHKKLLAPNTQQDLMGAVKGSLLQLDPKLQETLRLVHAHQRGVLDPEFLAQGAGKYVPPSFSSTSSFASCRSSVVVSSCFLRCLFIFEKLLGQAGISCGILQGSMSVEQRKAVLQDFEEGRIEVLLLSQYCGAEGITLTSSSRLILTDVGLSPSMAEQVMARLHRLGQEKEVLVSRLCAATSIEDFLIHDLLPQKLKVISDSFLATGSAGGGVKEEREEYEDEDEEGEERGGWVGRRDETLEDALGVLEAMEEHSGEGVGARARKVQSIAQGVAQYWLGGSVGEFKVENIGDDECHNMSAETKLTPLSVRNSAVGKMFMMDAVDSKHGLLQDDPALKSVEPALVSISSAECKVDELEIDDQVVVEQGRQDLVVETRAKGDVMEASIVQLGVPYELCTADNSFILAGGVGGARVEDAVKNRERHEQEEIKTSPGPLPPQQHCANPISLEQSNNKCKVKAPLMRVLTIDLSNDTDDSDPECNSDNEAPMHDIKEG